MYKFLFLITCIFLTVTTATAQLSQAVYFELGGPGLASINYDTRFTQNNGGIGGRVGIGGFSIDDETALFFPIQLNYLLGKDEKNYFELGGGATIVSINTTLDIDEGNFRSTFGHLYFGYRLQPADGGFLFRAGICPIFGKGFFI